MTDIPMTVTDGNPMVLLTLAAINVLDAGGTPRLRRTCDDGAPSPIYDALVVERLTGRDSTGRFVRWAS